MVIDLLDANRARDKSHFEHFIPFHQAFYKTVEPLTVTPFTDLTIDKMLASLLVTYVRHSQSGRNRNTEAIHFEKCDADGLIKFIEDRFSNLSTEKDYFLKRIKILIDDWYERATYRIKNIEKFYYEGYSNEWKSVEGFLKKPQDKDGEKWRVMQSMRDVDTNSFIQIKHYK